MISPVHTNAGFSQKRNCGNFSLKISFSKCSHRAACLPMSQKPVQNMWNVEVKIPNFFLAFINDALLRKIHVSHYYTSIFYSKQIFGKEGKVVNFAIQSSRNSFCDFFMLLMQGNRLNYKVRDIFYNFSHLRLWFWYYNKTMAKLSSMELFRRRTRRSLSMQLLK